MLLAVARKKTAFCAGVFISELDTYETTYTSKLHSRFANMPIGKVTTVLFAGN